MSAELQQNIEATLTQLIAIRSESNDADACREAIVFCGNELAGRDLHITSALNTDHPWLIATTRQTKRPKVMFVAHLDVAPGDFRQFEAQVDGDKLLGRGAWDMKFAAACFIELFKDAAFTAAHDIGIMLTTDEEVGGWYGAKAILEDGWRPDIAIIPDVPEGWKIESRAKGLSVLRIRASGVAGHGSRPWEGENAIEKLLPVLHELRSAYPNDNQAGPTLSINAIAGGEAYNQIPDAAETVIDFRSFDARDFTKHTQLIERLSTRYNVEADEIVSGAPLNIDIELPLVQEFANCLKEATGRPVEYRQSYGGSDARWFALHDVPCVVAGIDGHGFHADDEWIKRSDLSRFYQLLKRYAERVAAD